MLIIALASIVAWYFFTNRSAEANGQLQGSGTVEVVESMIAPELAGRVSEVLVEEGELVEAGQVLFRLDDDAMQAQRLSLAASLEAALAGRKAAEQALPRAQAAVRGAQAGVEAAQAVLETAALKYQQVLDAARLSDTPRRTAAWAQSLPSEFELPAWYFSSGEALAAAGAETVSAEQALREAQAEFEAVLAEEGGEELVRAEERVWQAQAAFLVAVTVLEQAQGAGRPGDLEDQAQALFDDAKTDLEEAQDEYDQLLSDESAANVSEVRAFLAIAQERYAAALDELATRRTGDQSTEVQLANLAIRQAEASLAQAQAALEGTELGVAEAGTRLDQANALVAQNEANLHALEVQLEKLLVRAEAPGVVLTRNIQPGEVIQPGGRAMTLGSLDDLTITVYLPEDRYGTVSLGDHARVTVDSYPGQAFDAVVVRIADQAEFTPRNVQTEEGRRTTVYAVELSVEDPQGMLKPGMPADVFFEE
ncbi:MAG TPA: HlyD family efflux transporter periplasmic adaptor subunit [Anaerolineales bacterium]|nr:HlyD family efflux transporter periplasmic adaptor subunit [Anaerolineales bacterium]